MSYVYLLLHVCCAIKVIKKLCTLCDQHAIEDARHFIMHCQFFQSEREEMFNEICRIDETIGQAILDSQTDILFIILVRAMENVSETVMDKIWRIVLNYVYWMYRKNSKEKKRNLIIAYSYANIQISMFPDRFPLHLEIDNST